MKCFLTENKLTVSFSENQYESLKPFMKRLARERLRRKLKKARSLIHVLYDHMHLTIWWD
jgi:hypothetical protein